MYPNLDAVWDHPPLERFYRRLASFSRLILFNTLGTGLSDLLAPGTFLTPEEHSMAMRDVLDAIDSGRTAVRATDAGVYRGCSSLRAFPSAPMHLLW